MKYEIKGTPMPTVICYLDQNEMMKTEKGAMSCVRKYGNADKCRRKCRQSFLKMFSGESMFQNTYTAMNGPGMIAFSSSFPGEILPVKIEEGKSIVAQKSAFLAQNQELT